MAIVSGMYLTHPVCPFIVQINFNFQTEEVERKNEAE